MPLPTARNTTYVASDPVKANDLNAIQDAIVARQHGEIEITFPAHHIQESAGTVAWDSTNFIASSGSVTAYLDCSLPVGTRVKSANVTHKRNGSGSYTIKAFFVNHTTGVRTQVGDTMTISSGSSIVETIITSWVNTTVAAGEYLQFEFVFTSPGSDHIKGARITCDKP